MPMNFGWEVRSFLPKIFVFFCVINSNLGQSGSIKYMVYGQSVYTILLPNKQIMVTNAPNLLNKIRHELLAYLNDFFCNVQLKL